MQHGGAHWKPYITGIFNMEMLGLTDNFIQPLDDPCQGGSINLKYSTAACTTIVNYQGELK